jgi:hypothetical protein
MHLTRVADIKLPFQPSSPGWKGNDMSDSVPGISIEEGRIIRTLGRLSG